MDRKTDVQGIFRTDSGALVNKDNSALLAYKKRKQSFQNMDKIEEEVKELRNELSEIKEMLRKVLK